ncbi:MAG: serine/threonine-protein kinase [Gemmataceae bacterium]
MAAGATGTGDGCPDRQILADFYDGRLADPAAVAVADHVGTCLACETALSALRSAAPGSGLDIRLRRCLVQAPFAADSPYLAMEAAALAAQWTEPYPPGTDAPDPPVSVGRVVGRYQIIGRLGEGGMGAIYLARQDPPAARLVALKIIRPELTGPEAKARFRVEVAAAARLEHPNVVRLYEFGEADGWPYFAMELIAGGTLAARLQTGRPAPRLAAELIRDLARGVGAAHAAGVVHRDLKPGNVLLARDGTPKVSDFGLARFQDLLGTRYTLPNQALGTPPYMAPEQANGRPELIGPRTDVYALGAILYECLTGDPPFRGETAAETLRLVREAKLVPPSRKRRDVPADLEAVCLNCLEKRAEDRYASTSELIEDLDRWLANERPQHTPGWGRRIARRVGRRRASALAGFVTVVMGGLAAGELASRNPGRRDPERVRQVIERELAAGRAVTLIGEQGEPVWGRWLIGETDHRTFQPADGAFTVYTPAADGMLELVPAPQTESYKVTAEVRHEQGHGIGEVGLYVARQEHPGGGAPVHFFTSLTFDDVSPVREIVVPTPGSPRPSPPSRRPRLQTQVRSEPNVPPDLQWVMAGSAGPEFRPSGGTAWRAIELTVRQDGVDASWDGQQMRFTAEDIRRNVAEHLQRVKPRFPNDPFVQQLHPSFAPRGGLGLYLQRGTASFRRVRVEPLTPLPDKRPGNPGD